MILLDSPGVLKPTVKPLVKRLGVGSKVPPKRMSVGKSKVCNIFFTLGVLISLPRYNRILLPAMFE